MLVRPEWNAVDRPPLSLVAGVALADAVSDFLPMRPVLKWPNDLLVRKRKLAGIWIEVLGVKRVGVHDDFFELGGHSLMAAQLVARVTESLQVGLPLRRLFDTPTIAGLAEHVDTLQWALRGPTD